MKHAIIVDKSDNSHDNLIEVSLTDDSSICLAEAEYSQEELEAFRAEAKNWVLQHSGEQYFYADRDSGEDAEGYFCQYFDLTGETAVFDHGKFVGFYVCFNGFSYSGNDRASFSIDGWHFYDPFSFHSMASSTHLVLFDREETHIWRKWMLLKREPEKEYKSCLLF